MLAVLFQVLNAFVRYVGWILCVSVAGLSRVFWLAAECGDYVEAELGYSTGYLKSLKLLPHQTEQLEMKIMGHHREHLWDILILPITNDDIILAWH